MAGRHRFIGGLPHGPGRSSPGGGTAPAGAATPVGTYRCGVAA